MKIAVVTDDQSTVCPHFGRATHYLVFTVEGNTIVETESRPKAGHHGEPHGHDHHLGAEVRHQQMVEAIQDCRVVIVGGMGQGAKTALEAAAITPCSTEHRSATDAVYSFLTGGGTSQPECRNQMQHS